MKKYRYTLAFLIFLTLCFLAVRNYKPEWITSDRELMWQTSSLGDKASASTTHAIKAAARFFDKTDLIGMTREEVIATVGDPIKSSDSSYSYPYYMPEKGVIVYRFDNGAYGRQYDIIFDNAGKVKAVKEQGIKERLKP